MTSIYIHIPFCLKKCHYCDFVSYENLDAQYDNYFNSLKNEIESFNINKKVDTIFFGGGTPSLFPLKYLEQLIKMFEFNENYEATIEVNPETVNFEKLQAIKNIGFNRISIGLQSFSDNLLKTLGRVHNVKTFLNCYENALKAGFENINIDLMFSLPDQSLEDLRFSLSEAMKLNPTHISCYSLIIEEDTLFHTLLSENKIVLPSTETDRNMYTTVKDMLKQSGYNQYEISNFSKDGFPCRQNLAYWKRTPYVGFGVSAHSFYEGRRFSNVSDIFEYIENPLKKADDFFVDKKASMEEFMFLGLRLLEGISISEFFNEFSTNIFDIFKESIEKHQNNGLLEINGDRLFLTDKGIDLSNYVLSDFLIDEKNAL